MRTTANDHEQTDAAKTLAGQRFASDGELLRTMAILTRNAFEDRANHQIRTLPSGRRSGCGATDGRTFVGWIKLFFYTERAKQSARDIAV